MALRSEERDVELRAGGARFHLRTLAAEDFPRFPESTGEVAKLPAGPLAETIDRVARAASRDEVRPILTGVLVQAEGTTLTMVATDRAPVAAAVSSSTRAGIAPSSSMSSDDPGADEGGRSARLSSSAPPG